MAYYISNSTATITCIKDNAKFSTINELYNLLNSEGWNEMTVYLKNQWNPALKCSGQCNSTALLVQEYFGGDIINYPNPNGGDIKKGHCFNRINGVDIDLTSEQFTPRLTGYSGLTKKANLGRQQFSCERAAYILKLKLGL